ncbi:hypothetical protein CROQUDRAFT_701816 [Cronartium quercuum f. sp. fusiforme G11]|uniref:Uncharacterized protein n=1 Tax=Cronartium quercuum f. sp. fusiforme G11 TaxID=708437 RepID=A0A9P6NJD4_9BASI|nr:hypothetical protein CROQUDRAFT_701816 [Cronartium quercuum f. sp. fusiforme G11]
MSEILFSNLRVLPNHHYALHIGTQISWWGPMMQMAEFTGERLISVLQRYKTNSRDHTNRTIMRKFCQLQRFTALKGFEITPEEPKTNQASSGQPQFVIADQAYRKIFDFCREKNSNLQSCANWSSNESKEVLSNHASKILALEVQNGRHITSKKPNNIIEYLCDGKTCYGRVTEILKIESGCESAIISVIELCIIKSNTLVNQFLDCLNVLQVEAHGKSVYVHQQDIKGPVPFRTLPARSLGCAQPTILLQSLPQFISFESEFPADSNLIDVDENL